MVTEPSNDSFAATTTAAADVKLEAEKSRLLYLFDQVEKGILIDGLKNSITAGNREVIQAISNVFDESVFPPRSSAMCARCEREFDPNYNTVTSCKLYHPGENIDRIHKFRNGSTWQCYTCNKTWNSDDCCDFFGVDTGFCFVGPHTAVEYELDKDFEHEDDLEEVKRKKYWWHIDGHHCTDDCTYAIVLLVDSMSYLLVDNHCGILRMRTNISQRACATPSTMMRPTKEV